MKKMKNNYLLFVVISMTFFSCIQDAKTNTSMETMQITNANELKIEPSGTSSEKDFDFLEGKWKVHNRKLKTRLNNSNDWSEFESALHMRKVLTGLGNVENYYATLEGQPFEGMAIRLFNRETKLWTIYWVDSNGGMMDQHPVSGSFYNGVGKFYAKDIFDCKDIVVLYQWDATKPSTPIWKQAFSTDNGKTWEWNWIMTLSEVND